MLGALFPPTITKSLGLVFNNLDEKYIKITANYKLNFLWIVLLCW